MLTLLGEIHGTCEAPRATLALARESLPARIGLEIDVDEQPRVDAFLRDGDRAALLAGPFWTRDFQDGRSSQAMAALLDEVRQLRLSGADLDVFLVRDESHDDVEADMADRILRAMAAAPQAHFVVLVGNLHARRVRGAHWDPQFVPMGAHLAERVPLTSLHLTDRGGTAWFCRSLEDRGRIHALSDLPPDLSAYDGELVLGEVTASPPAV